jgi:hypothetical protein
MDLQYYQCDASGVRKSLSVIRHVNQLIALNDVALVESLYRTLLKRAPDPDGMEFYVGQLRAGYSKGSMLVAIAASPETKAAGLELPGLRKFIGAQRRRDRSLWRLISGKRQREMQMNRLENTLGRILNDVAGLEQEVRRRLEAIEEKLQLTTDGKVDEHDAEIPPGPLRTGPTMPPLGEPGEMDLSGVPLVARRIFRELSAAIEAVDKPKIM